jgi:hypothetical protein
MKLARVTFLIAVSLIVVGVTGYIQTQMVSVTALIPAFIGIFLGIVGLFLRREPHPRWAVWVALALAGVCFAGGAPGLATLPAWLTEGVCPTAAETSRAVMAGLAIVYVLAAILLLRGSNSRTST